MPAHAPSTASAPGGYAVSIGRPFSRFRARNLRQLRLAATIVVFLLPAALGLILFQFVPLLVAVQNSFQRVSLLNPDAATPVGFANYAKLIHDTTFWQSLVNTLVYVAGKLVIQIPLGLLAALLVNQRLRGTAIMRSALFAPLVTSGAVIAVIWNLMYYPDHGLFNALLNSLGLPAQPFLTSTRQALPAILIMGVWQDIGFTMLLFLGGLQAIPETFYEAAAIDGANQVQSFRFVTLPLLRRTTVLALFMATIFSFRLFTPIYVMTQGGPQNATINAVYYIYEQGFKFLSMGYASAIAVVMIAILTAIIWLQNRLLRSDVEY